MNYSLRAKLKNLIGSLDTRTMDVVDFIIKTPTMIHRLLDNS